MKHEEFLKFTDVDDYQVRLYEVYYDNDPIMGLEINPMPNDDHNQCYMAYVNGTDALEMVKALMKYYRIPIDRLEGLG